MEDLDAIFRNPRVHTGLGYQQKRPRGSEEVSVVDSEEKALRQQLSTLDLEIDSLQKERAEVAAAIAEFERKRQRAAEAEAAEARRKQRQKNVQRGTSFETMNHNAEDVENMWSSQNTLCVALGSHDDDDYFGTACTAMLYDDGDHAWTSGMPQLLYNKLNGRGRRKHPFPTYLAMGTKQRYYLKFADGSSEWAGNRSDGMDTDLNDNEYGDVTCVAFGTNPHSYFILRTGGSQWCGLPDGMENAVFSNKYKKKDIASVALGPDNEWWVMWTDGTMKWNNTSDKFSSAVRGKDVKQVLFGPNATYFIRYNPT